MRPGRELDCSVAEKVFGHRVYVKKGILFEETPKGERPLRNYAKEMEWAWEVADKMKISLIPVESHCWFAFVGAPEAGWKSPDEFIQCVQGGNFKNSGASVGDSAARVICEAALYAVERREKEAGLENVVSLNDAAAADKALLN